MLSFARVCASDSRVFPLLFPDVDIPEAQPDRLALFKPDLPRLTKQMTAMPSDIYSGRICLSGVLSSRPGRPHWLPVKSAPFARSESAAPASPAPIASRIAMKADWYVPGLCHGPTASACLSVKTSSAIHSGRCSARHAESAPCSPSDHCLARYTWECDEVRPTPEIAQQHHRQPSTLAMCHVALRRRWGDRQHRRSLQAPQAG